MIVTAVAAIFNRQDLVDQTRLALTSEVPASPNWIVLILVAVVAIAGILIQQRMFGGRNTYSFDV
jgi:hypothetical protein